MRLDEDFKVVEPNVGDAELTRIGFDTKSICLQIMLACGAGTLTLRLVNPRWFSFSTDHPQNVIESITITGSLAEFSAELPPSVRELLARRGSSIGSLKVIRIKPCAGPELTCVADDVQQA
jgi:hypothetical protein